MTRGWGCGLQGAVTCTRLSLSVVLLCASTFIGEFCGFVPSSSCHASATRFRPYNEAVPLSQHVRRLQDGHAQVNTSNKLPMHDPSTSAESQQRTAPKSADTDSAARATLADADATARTSSDSTASTNPATAGAVTANEEKLPGTDPSSLLDLNSPQGLFPQLPDKAASSSADKKSVMRVSQLLRPEGRLQKENSGAPHSAHARVGTEREERTVTSAESEKARSNGMSTHTAEESSALTAGGAPAGSAGHRAAAENADAEPPADAGVSGDQESTGDELVSQPPLSGQEAAATPSASPSASRTHQRNRPTEADLRTHSPPAQLGGIAAEAASKWEELSRQHQQMLLSHSLTSIIKLFVNFTRPDHMTPWQMKPPRHRTGSAFVVEGRLLLTSAHVVDWQTRVLARRHGNARKFSASVVAVAHDCDLALLRVDDEEFWEGLQPLAFGQIPQLRDTVTLLGYPTGGDQLSITEGVVSRIGMSNYAHSSHELLTVQIDAAINPGNAGGPALVAGKVVGVAFQGFSELQSIGYIVPYPVVRHFLNDLALHKRFTGFPTLGIKATNLENQGMKEYKKLTTLKPSDLPEGITATGVVVVEVDSLRKERYLKGLMRLPYASTVLPPEAQIKQLLPEDPAQKSTPAPVRAYRRSLPQHRLAALTPENAVSSASLPPLGIGVTVVPPNSAAGGNGAAPAAFEHGSASLPPGAERSEAAFASAPPLGDQNEKDQQYHGEREEQQKRPITSEDDLIVPNVHYDAQQAVDADLVGLEVGDVLLAVDGIDVADDGTVPFRGMERNQLEFTVMNRFNGECAKALVLRDGKLMNILAPLTTPNMVIPPHTWDMKPKYFVFGGLVFVQLTKTLVEQAGHADLPNFVYAMISRMVFQEKEKDEIIVLTMILPSALTIGYNRAGSVVRKVQGHAVRNLGEMVQLVEECTDPFLEFIVEAEECEEVPIVLDRKKALELNPKIQEQHGIPRDRSLFL